MNNTSATKTTADAAAATTAETMHVPLPRAPLEEGEPTTLVEMFERAAEKFQKPDALNYKRDGAWHSISSSELVARARRIALGLHALGLRHGDRAALLSDNCPEWTLADAGCQFAGVIDVPIYPTQTPAQAAYILNDSGAQLLFISHRAAFARIQAALENCPALKYVVFFDASERTEATTGLRALSLAELETHGSELEKAQPELANELARHVEPDDLATIIYTSGTTGESKGVMLTHSNIVSNLIDVSHHLGFSPHDVALSVLPLSHIFERTGMYMYTHRGISVFYAESLEKIGDNMREVRPTLMLAVPRLFEKIYARIKEKAAAGGRLKASLLAWAVEIGKLCARHTFNHQSVPLHLALQHKLLSRIVFSKWRTGMGGRIRLFVCGGAALPEELGYIFAGAGLPIMECYGLTETSPGVTINEPKTQRIGTVGRTIPHVKVRIAPDGEIETRGPNIMRGYYNKPAETAAVFTSDGWFKTGDIGALDAENYLRITDRKKELFKTSGGKYIAPQFIEQLIKNSRFVNQVVLVGNGRKFPAALIVPDWEQVKAYAALKNIEEREPAELLTHPRIIDLFERQIDALSANLAQYERVKRVALLEHELTIEGGELTPTMKVKRRVVDEKYRDVIDRIYKEAEGNTLH
ncbi:MAG: AMP-dependent synthetase/ligase [Pyrinomonadaceae bacterium]